MLLFDFYVQHEIVLAQVQLVLFMLAMGATLSLKDFGPVFKQPRDLLYGLSIQLVLLPLVALGFALLFQFPAGLALGLVLVAALPGGTLSNVFTFLGRGHVALSIALTAGATVLSIVTIPFVLRLLAGHLVPDGFVMPLAAIVRELLLCLLIPLGVGMLIGRFAPRGRKWISRSCLYAGGVMVVLMIVGALGSQRLQLEKYHWSIFAVLILFCIFSQHFVMLPYRLRGGAPRVYTALGNEVTVRNIYLGLLLTALMFPAGQGNANLAGDVLAVLLAYGGIMFGVGLPFTLWMRHVMPRMQDTATEAPATTNNSWSVASLPVKEV